MATMKGTVERVVHRDGSFVIFKMAPRGRGRTVTVLGDAHLHEGEQVEVEGEWHEHPEWGRQLRLESYRPVPPATEEGIERFLAARVDGVGGELARRIVGTFGDETLEVLDEAPERLREVEGIGEVRGERIAGAWSEQKAHRDALIFLQGLGLGPATAHRVATIYGDEAIARVREDPYRLARDVPQVGFRRADGLARSMGLPVDSPLRARAGIGHVLEEAASEGHVGLPVEVCLGEAREILELEDDIVRPALEDAVKARDVDREGIGGQTVVYLPPLRRAEAETADWLVELADGPRAIRPFDPDEACSWFEDRAGVRLADGQREAVSAMASSTLLVVTGGPGVGKTTVVRALCTIAGALDARVALAAPTGRAAKRLQEATGVEAKTIHRLLEVAPGEGFRRDADRPVEADLLVVDEASMLDVSLARCLFRAVRPGTILCLVGDVDQLPSVGPGRVLADVIESGVARVCRLTEIFRQAEGSGIVRVAHGILEGRVPDLPRREGPEPGDFYFVEREEPQGARDAILRIVAERIPARFGLDPVDDVQVLAPMRRGVAGVDALNEALRERTGPDPGGPTAGPDELRAGDKVMQVENDYDRGVFNGDIGRVARVSEDADEAVVRFDGRDVAYDASGLRGLEPAYAISVHKSQGSEYPAVVLPLLTQHYVMLRRNLIYTGLTRGSRLVVVVGQRKALAMAVRNDADERRHTWLQPRIRRRLEG